MNNKFHIIRIVGLCLILFASNLARAQFVEFAPLQIKKIQSSAANSPLHRIQDGNSLPFWDDFSGGMDTLKWSFSGATFTNSIGLDPPSYGAILLDGVGEDGRPYSVNLVDQGGTDSLTSKPFNLDVLNSSEKESLYLSFFWQAGGRAERPDENDVLSLEVISADGRWISIWQQFGGIAFAKPEFTQEIIKIPVALQHSAFQFRFVTEGRKSGPFDSWLIDYVFFNSNRSPSDTTFLDRSLTRSNHLRIDEYGAYPLALLESNQEGNWSKVENEFYNLENRFRAMEYSISIQDPSSGTSNINSNTPFNPVPNSLERRVFESREIKSLPLPKNETILKIKTALTTGDDQFYTISAGDTTYYPSVDFSINDTVTTSFPLMDYFAYDNGSADYAAGINQRSGQLAVKYNSPKEVYLKGISINFTNPRQANQAIDLIVWKDLDQKPIFLREDLIAIKEAGEDFLYYSLDTNLKVSGDFFIGYSQFTNDFIHVGLDKENDSGEHIYYNVVGAWAQNTEVQGSLMIRPHVSLEPPFIETIESENSLLLYPNPVHRELNVKGEFSELRIFDSYGREIFLEREAGKNGEIINFSGQRPGIYIVNMVTKSGAESFRILVK